MDHMVRSRLLNVRPLWRTSLTFGQNPCHLFTSRLCNHIQLYPARPFASFPISGGTALAGWSAARNNNHRIDAARLPICRDRACCNLRQSSLICVLTPDRKSYYHETMSPGGRAVNQPLNTLCVLIYVSYSRNITSDDLVIPRHSLHS